MAGKRVEGTRKAEVGGNEQDLRRLRMNSKWALSVDIGTSQRKCIMTFLSIVRDEIEIMRIH
jgi:hypothetical protein